MQRAEFIKLAKRLREEVNDSATYELWLLPTSRWLEAIACAKAGDREVQEYFDTFVAWSNATDDGRRNCFSCSEQLMTTHEGGDGIGAFGTLRRKQGKGGVCLTGACCPRCAELGYTEMKRRFFEVVAEGVGIAADTIQ